MAEFSTNPGDRSVSELEREVDRERERVSATIDELQARASVGSLVDQLVKAVGENGGEVSRNLGRSLRDNPLAALLTGVGLAWLMAGSGRPPRRRSTDWEDPDRDYPATGAIGFRRRRGPARPPTEAALAARGRDSEYADRDAAPRRAACASALPTLPAGLARGSPRLSKGCASAPPDVSHSAGARLNRAGDTIREAGGAVRHRAGAARRSAAGTSGDMRHGLDTLIEDQPLVARGHRDGAGSRRRRGSPALAGRGSDVR